MEEEEEEEELDDDLPCAKHVQALIHSSSHTWRLRITTVSRCGVAMIGLTLAPPRRCRHPRALAARADEDSLFTGTGLCCAYVVYNIDKNKNASSHYNKGHRNSTRTLERSSWPGLHVSSAVESW